MTRVRGVDAARGLALIGMVIAHLDTRIDFDPGVVASWRHVGDGRAAVLFVVVAGFSLALSTGGTTPHRGRRLSDDRLAILVRAAVLAGLGAFLTALGTPVAVVLTSYAAFFVLALPLLRSRPVPVIALGTALVVLGPLLAAWATRDLPELRIDPAGALLVGYPYPAVQWTGYLLIGLGLGRIRMRNSDLATLALTGLGVGVVLHALVLDLGGRLSQTDPAGESLVVQALMSEHRSQNPIEAASALAIAVGLLTALVLLAPHARGLLYPLEAVGRMTLTLYVAHVVAYAVAIEIDPSLVRGSGLLAVATIVVALAFAGAWFRRFRRGPLERALHEIVVRTQAPAESRAG
ncbi:DUF418 domain-containing protein [Aeromicrobium senzhongii]|uniref:DUF418 domain-containing protein n=1 Tax=Aeromicrobium senzhongii TaxID=2663859 RepID=A0ABX6SR28_9ACTN|nr:DUF418 domain-containing protein [Aeromicrobium senzhongii]MTB89220.1 DUF418 domain-containing protein [Aeromicrobium senzhongii]QNL93516.1 DUF418 domain-containing protein [Aeromicrobium senzhongii]